MTQPTAAAMRAATGLGCYGITTPVSRRYAASIIDAEFRDAVEALRAFVDPWNAGGHDYMAKLNYDTFNDARAALDKLDR